MKKSKKKIIAIIVLIVIIIAGYLVFNNISIEKQEKTIDEYQDYTPEEEISDDQLRQTKVILFFANSETGELETEIKVVDAKTLIENVIAINITNIIHEMVLLKLLHSI